MEKIGEFARFFSAERDSAERDSAVALLSETRLRVVFNYRKPRWEIDPLPKTEVTKSSNRKSNMKNKVTKSYEKFNH